MGRFSWTARAVVCALTLLAASGLSAGAAAEPAGPVGVQSSAWRWLEPAPQGENLSAISGSYVVGKHGTVVYTPDGGASWQAVASGTTVDLTLVQEIEPGTVLIGGGCTLLEQVHSAPFRRLNVTESERHCAQPIVAFSFLDANTGWVELRDGSVLLTTDGGGSFQERAALPVAGGTAVTMHFISPGTGFALIDEAGGTGEIFRTTDGGSSWALVAKAPAGGSLDDLAFPGPGIFYAVGGSATGVSLVLASTDGGSSWSERGTGARTGELSRISCSDGEHCLFTHAGGVATIGRTEDGGAQLLAANVPSSETPSLADASFLSPSDALAVGSDGTMLQSADGGATWGPAAGARGLGIYNELLRPCPGGSAYRPGANGKIAVLRPGGASTLQVPGNLPLVDVTFPTPQTGFALSNDGTLYRTDNGGVSWGILTADGVGGWMLAPDAQTLLIAGPTGVRRSTNSGTSFAPVGGSVVMAHRHGRTVRLALSRFPLFGGSETLGSALIAWGDDAVESLDGGANWRLIPRPLANGVVEALSFVTPSAGYVVSRQRLFFTSNSGRSWREISALGAEALGGADRISFSTVTDGYVVSRFAGSRDYVLHTSDGGRIWAPEQLPRETQAVLDLAPGRAFLAANGGSFVSGEAAVNPSKLSLGGAGRISRAQLHRDRGRVTLHGQLGAVSSKTGETVVVSWRTRGRAVWQHRSVTLGSSGGFTVTIAGIAASTDFVAQWAGDGPAGGAGSLAQGLTVTRR